jgi:hypothetical protein
MGYKPKDPRHENEMVYGSTPGKSTHNPVFVSAKTMTQYEPHGFSHFEKQDIIPHAKRAMKTKKANNPYFMRVPTIESSHGNLRVVYKKDSVETLNRRAGNSNHTSTDKDTLAPTSVPDSTIVNTNKLSQVKGGQISPARCISPQAMLSSLSISMSRRDLNTLALVYKAGLNDFDARTQALRNDIADFKQRGIEAIKNQTAEEREIRTTEAAVKIQSLQRGNKTRSKKTRRYGKGELEACLGTLSPVGHRRFSSLLMEECDISSDDEEPQWMG